MYEELTGKLRGLEKSYVETGNATAFACKLATESIEAIRKLNDELNTCRNELCLRCGQYKMRHLGACDDCRWRERA